jgi:ABC-2 type transport system permease protein
MIGIIAMVTLRSLLARRRAILMLLLAAVPIGLGLLARLRGLPGDPVERTVATLDLLVVRAVLPLIALVFGTAALGAELDDGTAIYLLTKPVPRSRIVAAKILAAAPATIVLVSGATLLTGLAIGGERGTAGVTLAFTIATAIGALLYVTLFVALSVVTSRALMAGLIYIVIWEGVLAGLFEGTQALSIRQYTLAIASAIDPAAIATGASVLAMSTAIVGSLVVLVGGFIVATRRLEVLELTGGD